MLSRHVLSGDALGSVARPLSPPVAKCPDPSLRCFEGDALLGDAAVCRPCREKTVSGDAPGRQQKKVSGDVLGRRSQETLSEDTLSLRRCCRGLSCWETLLADGPGEDETTCREKLLQDRSQTRRQIVRRRFRGNGLT